MANINKTPTASSIPDGNGGTVASAISTVDRIPTGGSTGQVLEKASATDYDLQWATISAGSITNNEVGAASSPHQITSSTYVTVNNTTYTPASGTWLVLFSSSGHMTKGSVTGAYAIFKDGTLQTYSYRRFGWAGGAATNGYVVAMHTQAIITVNGTEEIDVRANSSASESIYFNDRSTIFIKLA